MVPEKITPLHERTTSKNRINQVSGILALYQQSYEHSNLAKFTKKCMVSSQTVQPHIHSLYFGQFQKIRNLVSICPNLIKLSIYIDFHKIFLVLRFVCKLNQIWKTRFQSPARFVTGQYHCSSVHSVK